MTEAQELKSYLGVRDWLYFMTVDESAFAPQDQWMWFRLDAVTSDVEFKPTGPHNWQSYLSGEALRVGWVSYWIDDFYGR